MIEVKRRAADAPKILNERFGTDGKTELERAEAHQNGLEGYAKFAFSRYKSAAVKTALEAMFHGKCAYCESYYAQSQPVDVEHYRPKGKVDGVEGHPGYWWLGMDWTNLLPSCIDCNRARRQRTPIPTGTSIRALDMVELGKKGDFVRGKTLLTGKATSFPLAEGSLRAASRTDDVEQEKRLLLDPTRDRPQEHLAFHVDREHLIGIVFPRPVEGHGALNLPSTGAPDEVAAGAIRTGASAMGAVSIQVYGLNRLGLVQARTKLLRDLEFLLETAITIQALVGELDGRIAARRARMGRASVVELQTLEDDDVLDTRLRDRLAAIARRLVAEIRAKAHPSEPFAATALAWVKAFLEEA